MCYRNVPTNLEINTMYICNTMDIHSRRHIDELYKLVLLCIIVHYFTVVRYLTVNKVVGL